MLKLIALLIGTLAITTESDSSPTTVMIEDLSTEDRSKVASVRRIGTLQQPDYRYRTLKTIEVRSCGNKSIDLMENLHVPIEQAKVLAVGAGGDALTNITCNEKELRSTGCESGWLITCTADIVKLKPPFG